MVGKYHFITSSMLSGLCDRGSVVDEIMDTIKTGKTIGKMKINGKAKRKVLI